jgi:hypothetical protein
VARTRPGARPRPRYASSGNDHLPSDRGTDGTTGSFVRNVGRSRSGSPLDKIRRDTAFAVESALIVSGRMGESSETPSIAGMYNFFLSVATRTRPSIRRLLGRRSPLGRSLSRSPRPPAPFSGVSCGFSPSSGSGSSSASTPRRPLRTTFNRSRSRSCRRPKSLRGKGSRRHRVLGGSGVRTGHRPGHRG